MRGIFSQTFLIAAVLMQLSATAAAQAIPVELRETETGWQLLRDGKPYLIRGAGGSASLDMLAAAGGNSTRTWSTDDIDELLDKAHALGLSVTVGIWLGHERHGFDYGDAEQVREQFERARRAVLKYKDHPALLLWGIGNEMEGYAEADDPAIWQAVNDIAAMVKELDPLHPTMTVTAELGGERIKRVGDLSAIDIHGINAYGGGASLPQRYRAGGGTKPYVITEFGPGGPWEVATSDWGAPYELTSTQKAAAYRRTYESGVLGAPGLALGSYAFTWGYKMEATGTWFGMFLPDGSKLAAVDTMTELWSGKAVSDQSPVVEPLVVEGDVEADPGDVIRVTASVSDPEDGPMTTRWALRPESGEYATGGDFRPMLPDVDGAIVEASNDFARVRLPDQPGPYRLFLYASDRNGNAATANVPLLVKGERRTPMPFYVYRDGFAGMPWAPSGWMGGTESLALEGDHEDSARPGSRVVRMRYAGKFGWVGVAWQNPPNNWGDQPGGVDLTGATALEVWARGEDGGETIGIGVGIIGDEKPHPDSARVPKDGIVLTDSWQLYRVPLENRDLSSIKTGFYVTLTGQRSPVTVYLDDIRFVRDSD